ncbi:aldo/keto reductase [Paenibacillus camelliae]|uniref:aldo/keto reductase n=1 Tax=Paenibacillus camelliae TaxID=512410 RepID=UPI00203F4DCB|nr:aldo/keto reductase [Paenibacillus camelliae]MCM3632793.1 aldo/keto reductase [Paenibacillus camelliae]
MTSTNLMQSIGIDGVRKPITKLVLGSMMLNIERQEYSEELLDCYVERGGNTIDTAKVYGPGSAKAIGQWISKRNNREGIVLIGKGAHPDANGPRVNKAEIERDIEETFEWMQTDYVDVYMLHRDDPQKSVGYILEILNEQLEAGKCHALGVSNWTTARIEEANQYAESHGLRGFVCNSPNLSLAKPNEPRWEGCISANEVYVDWHERTQLPLLSWSSQAGGFFTGRYSPSYKDDLEAVRVYYNDENWERYRRASELAAEKGRSTNDIALSFVLHQPFPTCAIIGPNNTTELTSSLEALHVSLTPSEVSWLDLKQDTRE